MTSNRAAFRDLHVNPLVHHVARATIDRWRSIWPWGVRPRSPSAVAVAAISVAVATFIHARIGLVRPETVVFAPYYAATLVATLLGGGAAGILAMILGGATAYWMFGQAEWRVALFTLQNLDNWALYGASSVIILWAAVSYRRLLLRLRDEQQKRQLLHDELAHRLGNTLAIVQTVLNQSLATQNEVREKINARLAALAATNDLLFKSDWQCASLRDILISEFKPYDPLQVHWDGEDVQCPSQTATVLALIIHELTTNAAKYGALSKPDGRINISWHNVDGRLTIEWVESGSLAITPPLRKGFGTKLLYSAIKACRGEVETSFPPTGIVCRFSLIMPETKRA